MFCKNCGREIDNRAETCPYCGCPTDKYIFSEERQGDKPSMGFSVLGFLFPLLGLILYLVWKDDKPLRAKSVGKGALTGFIVSVVVGIIVGISGFAALSCLASDIYDNPSYYY